jgi:putative flippase GtrA
VKVSRPAPDDLCVQVSASPADRRLHRSLPASRHDESMGLAGLSYAYVRAHAVELVHFVGVGLGIAALNLLLLYVFRTRLHWPDPLAVTAMYTLGTVPHFVYHRWITYRANERPLVPQGLRYVGMLISNFVIMQLLVALAARVSISPYFAVVTSTGLTMIANFLLMTHVVFAREAR